MAPATRSKRVLEKKPAAKLPGRITRSHAVSNVEEAPVRTTRSRTTAEPVKDGDSARPEGRQKQKPSAAKTTKRRDAQKPNKLLASDEQLLDGTSAASLVDGGIPIEPSASAANNARDGESSAIGTDGPVDEDAREVDGPNGKLGAQHNDDPIDVPPHSREATPLPNDTDFLANSATDPNHQGTAHHNAGDDAAVGPNNPAVITAPLEPQRVKPRPIRRTDSNNTPTNEGPLDYDGDLTERIRTRRLKDHAVASAVPAVESLFDDNSDDQASTPEVISKDNNPAEVDKDAEGNSDVGPALVSKGRKRSKHAIVHDSDSGDNSEDNSHLQRKDSPRRYTAAEKGKRPQATSTQRRKPPLSPKPFALYADDDSEDHCEDDDDNDAGDDAAKRGPFPSWALEEAQKIRRIYIDSISALAVRAKKSIVATTNLVEGKESPKKDHYWNMYQSWYGEHGPTKKPAEMKISEYTKTIVKPAYDEFVDSKDDETTLALHFKDVRTFYESAQKESNKQRQEDGNAGCSINFVTTKFQHLSQWAYLNHDVHAIGFVFALAKDKQGRDLQRIFFGSPHMETLHKNMQSNIQQSLTDIRGELIVANTRLRIQALAPAPEEWLNKIDFSMKPGGERERDRDRRVLPEILRQLANTIIESRDAEDTAGKRLLKSFPWTNWANVAFRYQLTMINWPAPLTPCPGGEGFKNTHGISSKDLARMVRLWRNYKDNELNDDEADGLLRIVEWSPEEKDMDLEDQATIALVVDDGTKRESRLTVRESQDYLKLVGKRSNAQAKETAGAERQLQKGKVRRRLPDAEARSRPRPLPPRPTYMEIDDVNGPLADPNKPRGAAVGPDGRLLDASQIDFTEEGEEIALPLVSPRRQRHDGSCSPHHRRRSPSPYYRRRSASPHHRHHSPSTNHRRHSPSPHRRHEHVDNDASERPAKRARYHAPTEKAVSRYSPAKPAHKRTRNEDEDSQSDVEEIPNRKVKKLPQRARHPSHPVSRDSSHHPTFPSTSNSTQVTQPRRRQHEAYDKYDRSARNRAGSSNQLYTIEDEDFDDYY